MEIDRSYLVPRSNKETQFRIWCAPYHVWLTDTEGGASACAASIAAQLLEPLKATWFAILKFPVASGMLGTPCKASLIETSRNGKKPFDSEYTRWNSKYRATDICKRRSMKGRNFIFHMQYARNTKPRSVFLVHGWRIGVRWLICAFLIEPSNFSWGETWSSSHQV